MLFLLLKSFLLHWSIFQLCLLFRLTSSLFGKKKEQNHRYLKKGGRYVIMRLNLTLKVRITPMETTHIKDPELTYPIAY